MWAIDKNYAIAFVMSEGFTLGLDIGEKVGLDVPSSMSLPHDFRMAAILHVFLSISHIKNR